MLQVLEIQSAEKVSHPAMHPTQPNVPLQVWFDVSTIFLQTENANTLKRQCSVDLCSPHADAFKSQGHNLQAPEILNSRPDLVRR